VLGKVDQEYRKLYSAVLMKAHAELKNAFGIDLINSGDIRGMKEPKKDDFYLTSASKSKKLRVLLARSDKSGAFYGFSLVVLHSILMAPGQKLACRDILRAVRHLEPRFPLDLQVVKGTSALAVPELGDDFLGLIGRMRKVRFIAAIVHQMLNLLVSPSLHCEQEQYLVAAKDDVDGSDVSKMVYSFGPRFFVEVGHTSFLFSFLSDFPLLICPHVTSLTPRAVHLPFSLPTTADGQAAAGGGLLRAAGPARGRHHPPGR